MPTKTDTKTCHCVALIAVGLALVGCASQQGTTAEHETDGLDTSGDELTYYRDAKAILDSRCASCHRPGDIAPFALTTYEQVSDVLPILPGAIQTGSMPPWPPAASCQNYEHDRSLSADEAELLLTWLALGGPAGDPADAPPSPPPPAGFVADFVAAMPDAYTPTKEPDDYRCFVIPWEPATDQYVTAYEFRPGLRDLVHHVTVSAVAPSQLETLAQLDAADPGPGYTCFGEIGVPGQALGGWVPGTPPTTFPAETGMRVEAGSRLVMQIHYNTNSAAPAADQSAFAMTLTDAVERPLGTLPVLDFGWPSGMNPMTIPAGVSEVTHTGVVSLDSPLVNAMLQNLGIEPGEPMLVHQVGMHMHYLGRSGQLSIRRADGTTDCALEVADWDFNWQGRYLLRKPLELHPGDSLEIRCTWDNSAANQPIIDGKINDPADVTWGEGTRDEMCLGSMVVSRK